MTIPKIIYSYVLFLHPINIKANNNDNITNPNKYQGFKENKSFQTDKQQKVINKNTNKKITATNK